MTEAERQQLERLAANIRAGQGMLTPIGKAILRAAETGELTPEVKALISPEPGSRGIVMLRIPVDDDLAE
jgi:hypothetical protein